MLTKLCSLASEIVDLQKKNLEKEGAVLKAILEKATPLVPLLSEDCEQCYRREIVILAKEEKIQHEEVLSFFSEYRLNLYENGLLTRTHRYGEWSESLRLTWENTDEDVLTPEAAIIAFGFKDISNGLIKALGDVSSMVIHKEELEGDVAALTEAVDALR